MLPQAFPLRHGLPLQGVPPSKTPLTPMARQHPFISLVYWTPLAATGSFSFSRDALMPGIGTALYLTFRSLPSSVRKTPPLPLGAPFFWPRPTNADFIGLNGATGGAFCALVFFSCYIFQSLRAPLKVPIPRACLPFQTPPSRPVR